MKRSLLIVLFLIVGCSQQSQENNTSANKGSALSIDRILSKPSIAGTSPSSPSWSADSQQLAFLWNDSGLTRREIWAVKGDGDTTFSMGLKAAENAIKNAEIDKQDIDFIVFATLSPDYYFPGPGVQVQEA